MFPVVFCVWTLDLQMWYGLGSCSMFSRLDRINRLLGKRVRIIACSSSCPSSLLPNLLRYILKKILCYNPSHHICPATVNDWLSYITPQSKCLLVHVASVSNFVTALKTVTKKEVVTCPVPAKEPWSLRCFSNNSSNKTTHGYSTCLTPSQWASLSGPRILACLRSISPTPPSSLVWPCCSASCFCLQILGLCPQSWASPPFIKWRTGHMLWGTWENRLSVKHNAAWIYLVVSLGTS